MKLLKSTRQEIARALVNHAFEADYIALCSATEIKAEEIYNALFDEKTRKLMNSLPKEFLPVESRVAVYNSDLGVTYYLGFNGEISRSRRYEDDYIDRHMWRKIAAPAINKRRPYGLDCNYSSDAANELIERYNELNDNYLKVYNTTLAGLNKFNTHEQLLKGWPEVAPFVPKNERLPMSQEVGFPVDQMNAMLKLPVAET